MSLRIPVPQLLLLALLLCAAPASAQIRTDVREPVMPAADATPVAAAIENFRFTFVDTEQSVRPVPARTRRRPSMVGYIEDGTIHSQVRLRFDSGLGNNVPDRAEFFYAKCGCYQFVPAPAFDADAPGPGPGVPTELNYKELYAYVERAFNERYSVFGELPIRGIWPQGFVATGLPDWEGSTGIGDIRFGGKASLFDDGNRGVAAVVKMYVPTGDASKGLGTNHASIEPSLVFHGGINDRVGIEGQLGYWKSLGGSAGVNSDDSFAGDVVSWGIGPSFDAYRSDRVTISPVVELVGWRVIGGFQTCGAGCPAEAGGTNIVNIKFGARVLAMGRHSLYGGFGWHLTDAVWYDKLFRFEYRLGF